MKRTAGSFRAFVYVVGLVIAACGSSQQKSAPEVRVEGNGAAGNSNSSDVEDPGETSSSQTTGGNEPCALLKPAEVAALLGQEVGEPTPGGFNDCMWSAKSSSAMLLLSLSSASEFKIDRSTTEAFEGDDFEAVAGVGDDAFYGKSKGHSLVFRTGERLVRLVTPMAKDDASKAKLIELAKTLAGRM